MSERWIKLALDVLTSNNALGEVTDRYWAADDQRVESIRWCKTHGERALKTPGMICECCWASNDLPGECVCIDATLILPAEQS